MFSFSWKTSADQLSWSKTSDESSSSATSDDLAASVATTASSHDATSLSSRNGDGEGSSAEDGIFYIHLAKISRFYRVTANQEIELGLNSRGKRGDTETIVLETRNGIKWLVASSKAFEIMAQLGCCVATLDAAHVARLLDLHDVLARALPHTPQAASANNETSIKLHLFTVYSHVFPGAQELPPLESAHWEVT